MFKRQRARAQDRQTAKSGVKHARGKRNESSILALSLSKLLVSTGTLCIHVFRSAWILEKSFVLISIDTRDASIATFNQIISRVVELLERRLASLLSSKLIKMSLSLIALQIANNRHLYQRFITSLEITILSLSLSLSVAEKRSRSTNE